MKKKHNPDMTVPQLAEQVGVKISTVRKWIHDGTIPAYQLANKSYRIRWDWYLEFTEKQIFKPKVKKCSTPIK